MLYKSNNSNIRKNYNLIMQVARIMLDTLGRKSEQKNKEKIVH